MRALWLLGRNAIPSFRQQLAIKKLSASMAQGGARSLTIGTHNGHFHADEALAVHLLRTLPEYSSSSLIRTRDPALLDTCHTVVDVGGVYDASKNRYDHHQRDFETTFPAHSTKLSSAGLVYLHFGRAIIAHSTGLSVESEELELLYQKLYDDFIEAFDGNDNGIAVYGDDKLAAAGLKKRFNDRGFTLASVVNRLNFHYDSEAGKSREQLQQAEDERFLRASHFTGEQFLAEVRDKHEAWLPARSIVKGAYLNRFEHDPSGKVLVLPHKSSGIPWTDHLYDLEGADSETKGKSQVLYVLVPESGASGTKFRIRAVPSEPGSFLNRHPLPVAWRGLRDAELSHVAGISGCVFVHASGFIGGNTTFEGALAMAKKAVTIE